MCEVEVSELPVETFRTTNFDFDLFINELHDKDVDVVYDNRDLSNITDFEMGRSVISHSWSVHPVLLPPFTRL